MAKEEFPLKKVCIICAKGTIEVTVLRERKVGDAVNLEADMLGKYVEKILAARGRR